jgi:hypothetical protein
LHCFVEGAFVLEVGDDGCAVVGVVGVLFEWFSGFLGLFGGAGGAADFVAGVEGFVYDVAIGMSMVEVARGGCMQAQRGVVRC